MLCWLQICGKDERHQALLSLLKSDMPQSAIIFVSEQVCNANILNLWHYLDFWHQITQWHRVGFTWWLNLIDAISTLLLTFSTCDFFGSIFFLSHLFSLECSFAIENKELLTLQINFFFLMCNAVWEVEEGKSCSANDPSDWVSQDFVYWVFWYSSFRGRHEFQCASSFFFRKYCSAHGC